MGAGQIEPVWIDDRVTLAVHDRQLAEHGGGEGLRDPDALDSALARPRNRWAYGETDLCRLAAAYAFGIARNHTFVDGNKRTAFAATYIFLSINGARLTANSDKTFAFISSMHDSGTFTFNKLEQWLRRNVRR